LERKNRRRFQSGRRLELRLVSAHHRNIDLCIMQATKHDSGDSSLTKYCALPQYCTLTLGLGNSNKSFRTPL